MHHAYLFVADREDGIAHAREKFGLSDEAHPDVQILSYSLFSIDEARALKEWAYQRPVSAPVRHFLISCDDIQHASQNALLKLFEEPPQTCVFSLIMSREDRILPTLRSRLEVVRLKARETESAAEAFLKLPFSKRIEEVGARVKAKDMLWQREVLGGLERLFYGRNDHEALAAIAFIESMIGAQGSSPKMLLEHLALSLPRG